MSFPDDVIDANSTLTKEDAFSMLCCLLPMTHLTTLRFVLNELFQIANDYEVSYERGLALKTRISRMFKGQLLDNQFSIGDWQYYQLVKRAT